MIFVIITADDFLLTRGVSRGILEAVRHGVVSSTSALVTMPYDQAMIHQACRCAGLGIGLHFSLTLGTPVARVQTIPSLVGPDGRFLPRAQWNVERVCPREVRRELCAQLTRFETWFGRRPIHIDTHHHIHEHRTIFEVIRTVAYRAGIPVRRRFPERRTRDEQRFLSTDSLYCRFSPRAPWNGRSLRKALLALKPGVHEIVVHPGYADAALKRISTFTTGREEERKAVTALPTRMCMAKRPIMLIHYGMMSVGNERSYV